MLCRRDSYNDLFDALKRIFAAEVLARYAVLLGHDEHVLTEVVNQPFSFGIIGPVSRTKFALANDGNDALQRFILLQQGLDLDAQQIVSITNNLRRQQ